MDNLDMKIDELKDKAGEVYETAETIAEGVVACVVGIPIYAAYKAGEGAVKGVKALGKWLDRL